MPLPILHARYEHSDADLVRLFLQTEARWCEHMAAMDGTDVGIAFANQALPGVYEANHLDGASLAEGMTAAEAIEQVDGHFAKVGTRCSYWTMNPSAGEEATRPLVDELVARGFRPFSVDVMGLERIPAVGVPVIEGLKIIPTRASYRHARQLLEESAAAPAGEVVEAELSHLDDPHWDSLLALKDGEAVATAGVLAVGEIGRIDQVYVAKSHRRQGLGLLMMARVLETCARSLFKHVLLSVAPENGAARGLYERLGFRKVGEVTGYFAPGIDPRRCG